MKGPLKIGQAATLYAGLLSLIFVFYGLGISLGRSHPVEVVPTDPLPSDADNPVEDVKPQLDFYEGLSRPVERSESVPVEGQTTPTGLHEGLPSSPAGATVPTISVHTVQVGAFTNKTDMQQMLLRLDAKGYSSRVSESAGADPYFRVWVGEFKRPEDAREMEVSLRDDGFPTFIRTIPATR